MPERTIDEDGHPKRPPREVWTAGNRGVVASPSTYAGPVESPAKLELRQRIALANRRHDAPAHRGCSRIGHLAEILGLGGRPRGRLSFIGRMSAASTARRPTVVDLFSGAGGLSLGCEQAGMDVLASVEYDPVCTGVHKFNFPWTETLCSDAATLSAKTVRASASRGWTAHGREGEWDGVLDAVVGGPPCQGFSVIGRRAFDDPRNQLVFSFARLVGALRPRYFVMENVPGMASVSAGETSQSSRLLDLLVEEFEGFGYRVLEPTVLNACDFGVPQDRRRLILIGWREDDEAPASYPEPLSSGRTRRGLASSAGVRDDGGLTICPSVWDAIGDLPDLDDLPASAFGDEVLLSDEELANMEARASAYARTLRGFETDVSDLSYPRAWDRRLLTSAYRTVHGSDVAERYEATAPGSPEPVSRFFRLHPDGVSSTLRAGTHYERGSFNAPRPIHPKLARVVSVREAARLHSFPDWFRLHWTKWHGFREVGNALPPQLARAVAAEVVSALGAQPTRPQTVVELGDRELVRLENLAAAERFGADLTRIPRNALRRRDSAATAAT